MAVFTKALEPEFAQKHTVMVVTWWGFGVYPKTILCQGQVGPYEEMYQRKSGKGDQGGEL